VYKKLYIEGCFSDINLTSYCNSEIDPKIFLSLNSIVMKAEIRSFATLKLFLLSVFLFPFWTGAMAQRKSWTDDEFKAALKHAYEKFKDDKEGSNANYIPELDKVDPELFGLAIVTTDGKFLQQGILILRFPFNPFLKFLPWQK
jgi:hypothetical protein